MNYFNLLKRFTIKELILRYKRSSLGFLWVFLSPLLQMLIIGMVFSFFVDIPDYFVFLLAGLLPWRFFSVSVEKATTSFVDQRSLIHKARFNKEVIPLSIVLSEFFQMTIALAIFLFYLYMNSYFKLGSIPLLFLGMLWLLVLSIGSIFIFSSLYVRFRDVNHFVKILMTLGFYATPVLYSIDFVPSDYYILYALNPLTSVFELFRKTLIDSGSFDNGIITANLFLTLAILVIGLFIYSKENKHFADWV